MNTESLSSVVLCLTITLAAVSWAAPSVASPAILLHDAPEDAVPECSDLPSGGPELPDCVKKVLGPVACMPVPGPDPGALSPVCEMTVIPFDVVEPPMAHSLIETPVRLESGATQPVQVVLIGPMGQQTDVSWTHQAPSTFIGVPPGLDTGEWDVRVQDEDGSIYEAQDGLAILDDLIVSIADFDPTNIPQGESTTGTVYGEDPTPPGLSGFQEGALIYLSPASGGLATDLESEFIDESMLSTTIPGSLETGTYDVLVMNPDRSAGFLQVALAVE